MQRTTAVVADTRYARDARGATLSPRNFGAALTISAPQSRTICSRMPVGSRAARCAAAVDSRRQRAHIRDTAADAICGSANHVHERRRGVATERRRPLGILDVAVKRRNAAAIAVHRLRATAVIAAVRGDRRLVRNTDFVSSRRGRVSVDATRQETSANGLQRALQCLR